MRPVNQKFARDLEAGDYLRYAYRRIRVGDRFIEIKLIKLSKSKGGIKVDIWSGSGHVCFLRGSMKIEVEENAIR